MTDFRKQLQTAKTEYESVRYPGNLVSDLAKRRAHSPMRWMLPLGASIAAMIALVIWLWPTTTTVPGGGIGVLVVVPTQPTEVAETIVPSLTTATDDLMPSIPSATMAMPAMSVPSMPTIPTWSVSTDVSLEENSSTQG